MNKHILVIVAHPDDGELLFGSLISKCVGLDIVVDEIVVTDGSKWCINNGIENIKKVRMEEAKKAAAKIGINEIFFLEQEDGNINFKSAFYQLLMLIRKIKPTIIFTHSNCEGHFDHKIVYELVIRLCSKKGQPAIVENRFWVGEEINDCQIEHIYVKVLENECDEQSTEYVSVDKNDVINQYEALCEYHSQFSEKDLERVWKNLLIKVKFFGLRIGVTYAERIRDLAEGSVIINDFVN